MMNVSIDNEQLCFWRNLLVRSCCRPQAVDRIRYIGRPSDRVTKVTVSQTESVEDDWALETASFCQTAAGEQVVTSAPSLVAEPHCSCAQIGPIIHDTSSCLLDPENYNKERNFSGSD